MNAIISYKDCDGALVGLQFAFLSQENEMFYSNSVLTLYGLILAPILNSFKLPFLILES